MAEDCIFCKIVAGELPSFKIYEDSEALAFLDIGPLAKGHTLVIPKAHHDPITDTPPNVLKKLICVVRSVAEAQMKALNADGINVTQANGEAAGQIIGHIHFHVIPRFEEDGKPSNWRPGRYDSEDEISDYAERISGAMPGVIEGL